MVIFCYEENQFIHGFYYDKFVFLLFKNSMTKNNMYLLYLITHICIESNDLTFSQFSETWFIQWLPHVSVGELQGTESKQEGSGGPDQSWRGSDTCQRTKSRINTRKRANSAISQYSRWPSSNLFSLYNLPRRQCGTPVKV